MRYWVLYSDDSYAVARFEDGPIGLPTQGVQAVVVEDPELGYRVWYSPAGYWVWIDDRHGRRWHGCQTEGALWEYLAREDTIKYVLSGRELPDDAWAKVQAALGEGLPFKSAWAKREFNPHA